MGLATMAAIQEKGTATKPNTPDALGRGSPKHAKPEHAKSDHACPERTCIVSRQALPKDQLIRFVIGPEGIVTPDLDGKLPGRGLYVRPDKAALTKAEKKNLFSRVARQAVTVPTGLPDVLDGLLAKRCVEQIGLARRAGAAVAGFEKVRARLKQPGSVLILSALDGAGDGRAKVGALAKAANAQTLSPLDRAELAQAFGRDETVHAAIEIDAGFNSLLRYAVWLDAMRNQADNPLAAGGGGAGRIE